MERIEAFYDPHRKTGWPMVWLPQDVGGLSGEHVDWDRATMTPTDRHSLTGKPTVTPEAQECPGSPLE